MFSFNAAPPFRGEPVPVRAWGRRRKEAMELLSNPPRGEYALTPAPHRLID